MLDLIDAQDADLVEGPARDSLGEVSVQSLDFLLLADLLDLGVKPLIGKGIGGA